VSPRGWAQFAAVSLLWGFVYLLIKIVAEEVSAFPLTFSRALLSVLILVPLAQRRGTLLPLRDRFGALLILALLDVAGPFVLVAVGERTVPSSLAGMLVATVPIFVALLALRFDHSERVGGLRLAGLGVGIVGVALLLGVQVVSHADQILGAGMILLASVLYAGGGLYYRRAFAGADAIGVTAWVFVITAAVLVVPAIASAPTEIPSLGTLAALMALGTLCSAVVFVLWYQLIDEVGAGRAAVVTYVNPAIAVLLGVVLLGEGLTGGAVAGLVLIIGGSYMSTGGRVGRGHALEPTIGAHAP
jgi:drug/metabolite transporter (DMT)-like permease